MNDDHSPDIEAAEEEREDQQFGLKHLVALLFAGGLTAAIFIFRDQISALSEWSYLGVFIIQLLSNATVVLPAPGLIFVFVLGSTLNPILIGLVSGIAAAIGESSGYLAGYGSSAAIDNFKVYYRVQGWMEKYGLIVITVMASIPNPLFDIAGMVAGSLRIKWWKFLIATWIGKTIQGFLVAYAGYLSLGWVEQLLH